MLLITGHEQSAAGGDSDAESQQLGSKGGEKEKKEIHNPPKWRSSPRIVQSHKTQSKSWVPEASFLWKDAQRSPPGGRVP